MFKKIICITALILACVLTPSGTVCAKEDTRTEIKLPVVMYHSVLKSKSGKYIVSPSAFEEDLKAFLKSGYTFVFPSEVIDFCLGDGSLPDKPVLITFDDGHYNNMYYALPLIEKYNAKALISFIGKFTEHSTSSGDHSNPNYSHLTWAQLKQLQDGGYFEIGNHTYNMHNYKPRFGVAQKTGESREEYLRNLDDDLAILERKLSENGIGKPQTFAYPFGKYNDTVQGFLSDNGYKMMFTCNEGVSVVRRGSPESLYKIRRINRDGNMSSDELIKKIESFYR